MKKNFLISAMMFVTSLHLSAQENPLVLNKQGSFNVTDWGAYTHYDCGYTKAETSANYQKVLAVINAIKKSNPVLNELKGFDADILVFAQQCDPKFGYGIPVKITFGFCSWFVNKNGKEVRNKIEPPAWYINFNVLGQIGSIAYEPLGKKKAVTQKEKWEEAGRRLSELVHAEKKETLAPGIDRYNGQDIVVYNPDRPPYWLPITVREFYKLTYDYWRLNPDSLTRSLMSQMLDAEYATFTEEELDGYAYAMGKGAAAHVGNDEDSPQIMRPNPAYWNKNLPKSAIQIIKFILPANKTYLQNTADEYLKANAISYHEVRFELALDVYQFASLIDK